MPDNQDASLDFQCPKCEKRMKAGPKVAGRKVKCPKCGQVVRAPGVKSSDSKPKPVAVPKTDVEDLWLDLDTPAIGDIQQRKQEAESVKSAKQAIRRSRSSKAAPAKSASVQPIESKAATSSPQSKSASPSLFESDPDQFQLAPLEDGDERPVAVAPADPSPVEQTAVQSSATPQPEIAPEPQATIFDDDLPQLSELPSEKRRDVAEILSGHMGTDELAEVLADGPIGKRKMIDRDEDPNPEYRIRCRACDTVQYVRLSQQGDPIKCPDCFDTFVIPPPAPGSIKKKKAPMPVSTEPDVALADVDADIVTDEFKQRARANTMLEKAKLEMSDEEIDNLYDHDFDTSGFVQRTFGCFRDVLCLSQMVCFGVVFALLFGCVQFAANLEGSAFQKGVMLAVGILGPLIGILFSLPMLSGGLALIESVANKEPKLQEWPAFNLFDNVGDVLVILFALLAAILPGFFVGSFVASTLDLGVLVRLTAMMMTTFVLFPLFLLSMLDNGSLFQPVSQAVIQSIRVAAEAWGGYFLKTLIAFFVITVTWYGLLTLGSPMAAGCAGFLLPVLLFFTCQQIGALADSIGEHLSFEFVPESESDADDDAISQRQDLTPA